MQQIYLQCKTVDVLQYIIRIERDDSSQMIFINGARKMDTKKTSNTFLRVSRTLHPQKSK